MHVDTLLHSWARAVPINMTTANAAIQCLPRENIILLQFEQFKNSPFKGGWLSLFESTYSK
jgi:hypothetical protein